MENNNKNKDGITLKKAHLIVILLLLILLIIGGIFLGLNWNNWFGEKETTLDIDPDAKKWTEQIEEKKEEAKEEQKGIAIPGYPVIKVAADTENIKIALVNPEDNPCYFTFEIVLKENDESIYTSKLVPPGQAVTDLTLSKPLPAGEYEAVLKIATSSLENQSPMNGANQDITIVAE